MAGSNNTNRRNTKRTTTRNTSRSSASKTNASAKSKGSKHQDQELWYEVGLIVMFAFMVFLFLCNFGLVGPIGVFFKKIMFGLVGLTAYILPIFLFVTVFFGWVNKAHFAVKRKMIAGTIFFLILGTACEFFAGRLEDMERYKISDLYQKSAEYCNGGGVIGGSIAYLLHSLLDFWGSVLVMIVLGIICLVLITEKSFVKGVRKSTHSMATKARDGAQGMREYAAERAREREIEYGEQMKLTDRQLSGRDGAPMVSDRSRKVKGINFNSIFNKLDDNKKTKEDGYYNNPSDISEDTMVGQEDAEGTFTGATAPFATTAGVNVARKAMQVNRETVTRILPETDELHELRPKSAYHAQERITFSASELNHEPEEQVYAKQAKPVELKPSVSSEANALTPVERSSAASAPKDSRPAAKIKDKSVPANQMSIDMGKLYHFPPISLLQRGKSSNPGSGQRHLEETARRLQDCLHTFGVKVTITDISQGPAVTRYELQPEQGVKVSKILSLSDDIKLNLAATDIRIEAPIPGKSAIGIEVPNKENSAVAFRELIESSEFKDFPSKISFAVGKDIAGKIVVADIAKMPHMLIAGATGSGKSVCINTLIMSILYKAHPDEVKMIMIDPKVVELSSYNGIPHLLIPVVTDPKQAAGALQWGVSEMMARYEKFAELNVRDMKSFNAKVDDMTAKGDMNAPKKLPQIVIIVDELADLMMVAPGEVEEAICRLAQLARAAGIHLIIATQRPSVDVITGLIKANMPSRVAFAVSSGVDSRTILDMNGAEKLLGKGDMLFYPQGYSKPVRVQGSFVSDSEVAAVVDFLKNQQIGNVYQEEIQEQINNLKSGSGNATGGAGSRSDDKDALFADAGRFIIEKDKASIGMLQRVFKIGFNRAARIVDQLCEYGVVGDEEGTKPRKVLMSLEQFENLLEEI